MHKLKLSNQVFIIKDYLSLYYIKSYDLYAATYDFYKKPLFFVTPYLAAVAFQNNLIYADGLIKTYALASFLKNHKTILKDFYYDLAYKNTKKLDSKIYEQIKRKESIFNAIYDVMFIDN